MPVLLPCLARWSHSLSQKSIPLSVAAHSCLAHGVMKRRLTEQRAPRGQCGRWMRHPTKPSSPDEAVTPRAASSARDVPSQGCGQLKGCVCVLGRMQLLSPTSPSCSPVPTHGHREHQLWGLVWDQAGWGHRDQETRVLGCEGWVLLSHSVGRSWDTAHVPRCPRTIHLRVPQGAVLAAGEAWPWAGAEPGTALARAEESRVGLGWRPGCRRLEQSRPVTAGGGSD